jgi:3-dehydroquinate synthase
MNNPGIKQSGNQKRDINPRILMGESLECLEHYLSGNKTVIITDQRVHRLYSKHFPSSSEFIMIGSGETIKTLHTVEFIYGQFMNMGIDRTSTAVGIGGGIVCDITGYAASTFMRGINFVFAPTTLLAQADASIGGKNGVNLNGYKNMIGTINQPQFVLMDHSVLRTLPKSEILCGVSEIIKHAAIASLDMFSYLEQNWENALNLKRKTVNKLINDSVAIKSSIVEKDEKEKGERKKLNFGHTFAHSFEKVFGISHGEAVSLGMVIAARLSVLNGLLPEGDAQRLKQLLSKFNLPVRLVFEPESIIDVIRKDKKKGGDRIDLILLESLGKAIIHTISINELQEVIYDMCESG